MNKLHKQVEKKRGHVLILRSPRKAVAVRFARELVDEKSRTAAAIGLRPLKVWPASPSLKQRLENGLVATEHIGILKALASAARLDASTRIAFSLWQFRVRGRARLS